MARSKFRILAEHVAYPTDADVIARLLAGERVPAHERGDVVHVRGHVVDDVPACSIDHLLAEGSIARVDADVPLEGDADPIVLSAPAPVDALERERAWADLGRPDDADHDKGDQ